MYLKEIGGWDIKTHPGNWQKSGNITNIILFYLLIYFFVFLWVFTCSCAPIEELPLQSTLKLPEHFKNIRTHKQ